MPDLIHGRNALSFSHMGFYVSDLEKMTDFYSRILGFPVTDHGLLRGTIPITFLSRDPKEHHQIALIQARPEGSGLGIIHQISFRLADLESLQRLRLARVTFIRLRRGARNAPKQGRGTSR
mgnify:CR=1 FL=1